MRFLTVSIVFMGKPGQTNLELTSQKSQPISRVAAPRNRWEGCLGACEAPHVLADVSPCAACLCASVGTWLRQPAGRGGEGSSAPEADVNLPMRSCKGQMGYSAFLYRFDWETKHELATSCLQRKKLLFQQFCEHCYGSFQR